MGLNGRGYTPPGPPQGYGPMENQQSFGQGRLLPPGAAAMFGRALMRQGAATPTPRWPWNPQAQTPQAIPQQMGNNGQMMGGEASIPYQPLPGHPQYQGATLPTENPWSPMGEMNPSGWQGGLNPMGAPHAFGGFRPQDYTSPGPPGGSYGPNDKFQGDMSAKVPGGVHSLGDKPINYNIMRPQSEDMKNPSFSWGLPQGKF